MGSQVMNKAVIEKRVDLATQAKAKYEEARGALLEAKRLHSEACNGGRAEPDLDAFDYNRFDSERDPDRFKKGVLDKLDRDVWTTLVLSTVAYEAMGETQRTDLSHDLSQNPPEVTVDGMWATIQQMNAGSDILFRNGLVSAFCALDRGYRPYRQKAKPFQIGEKIVIDHGVSCWSGRHSRPKRFSLEVDQSLREVDRFMHALDGQPAPDYGIGSALRASVRDSSPGAVMTHYWRAKWWKNGKVELYPLREDLLAKANALIAEHFAAEAETVEA